MNKGLSILLTALILVAAQCPCLSEPSLHIVSKGPNIFVKHIGTNDNGEDIFSTAQDIQGEEFSLSSGDIIFTGTNPGTLLTTIRVRDDRASGVVALFPETIAEISWLPPVNESSGENTEQNAGNMSGVLKFFIRKGGASFKWDHTGGTNGIKYVVITNDPEKPIFEDREGKFTRNADVKFFVTNHGEVAPGSEDRDEGKSQVSGFGYLLEGPEDLTQFSTHLGNPYESGLIIAPRSIKEELLKADFEKALKSQKINSGKLYQIVKNLSLGADVTGKIGIDYMHDSVRLGEPVCIAVSYGGLELKGNPVMEIVLPDSCYFYTPGVPDKCLPDNSIKNETITAEEEIQILCGDDVEIPETNQEKCSYQYPSESGKNGTYSRCSEFNLDISDNSDNKIYILQKCCEAESGIINVRILEENDSDTETK